MAKDSLARGATSAQFPAGQAKKDDPIEFHGTLATAMADQRNVEMIKEVLFAPRVVDWSKYQPMNDRVLLRRIEQKSVKSVVLPDAFIQDSDIGEVLAVGEGMLIGGQLRPINLQPGDKVRFGHYNAEENEVEGEKVVLV